MGTRSGDLDPAIIEFVAAKEGLSMREIETLMNKHSGLLGISGLTSDMRELLAEAREENDRRSELAIEIFLLSRAEIHWCISRGDERRDTALFG